VSGPILVVSLALAATARSESVPPSGADSARAWLPAVEDLEEPDRLEDPDGGERAASGIVQFMARDDAEPRLQRVAVRVSSRGPGGGAASVGVSALAVGGTGRLAGVASLGSWEAGAGRLAVREVPALLSRRAGLTRDGSRVPELRASAPRADAARSASAPAVDGLWLARNGGRSGAWALAGWRSGDGAGLLLAGLRGAGRGWACAVAGGAGPDGPVASVVARKRGTSAAAGAEVLAGRAGVGLLAGVETRGGPLSLRARWRQASGDGRPAALDAAATLRGRAGIARLSWVAWTRTAAADNGAVEIETASVLAGGRPLRTRWVARPAVRDGTAAGVERYALVDAALATGPARSLALLASLRRGPEGRSDGRSLGGRLRLGREDATRAELLVQAARSRAGTAALGAGLHASGEATLAERVRSGLTLAARAVARRGPAELGCVLEADEGAGGARSGSASVWLRWLNRAPSGPGRAAAGPLPQTRGDARCATQIE
jgi:hypothetical protein